MMLTMLGTEAGTSADDREATFLALVTHTVDLGGLFDRLLVASGTTPRSTEPTCRTPCCSSSCT